MSSRTRVKRWEPPLRDALKLAWRPALVYFVFSTLGVAALVGTAAYTSSSRTEIIALVIGGLVGTLGLVLGQALALLRLRALPITIVTGIGIAALVWVIDNAHMHEVGEYVGFSVLFFSIAFPCGLLSLMHRYELFASFYPALGWIGAVFVILNEYGRVREWEESKVSAWLPVPLVFLALFLVFWLLYLAAKQAVRVELWQALSGAAERRISKAQKKNRFSALPRRNLAPLLVVAVMLFAAVAALAPYLWRTGKGDREGGPQTGETQVPDAPKIDADGLLEQMERLAHAAKETLPKLWPLLLLLVLYRPTKRALLMSHLKSPLVPTPPSERIDNLWEYVRISAEDAGVRLASADSVEALVKRVEALGRASPGLYRAAEIYARTRYGFVVQPGDATAMKAVALEAGDALRQRSDVWTTIKVWFRPLS